MPKSPSMVRVLVLVLLTQCTPQVAGSCSTPLVSFIEQLFNTSTPAGIAQKLLTSVQDDCKENKCPRVTVGTCQPQSVDDVNCPMHVVDTSVKLGTDAICHTGCDDWPCKAGCDDWPCKAGCQGIDVGICYGADYVLCKFGCLGISSCVHKCEHAIVDPCKKTLIDKCEHKCEAAFNDCEHKCDAAFNDCNQKCEKALTMDIGIEFDRMQRAVTSLSLASLDVNCTGNQLMRDPLLFNASATLTLGDVKVDLKVHTKDAGISSTNALTLDKVTLTTNLPMSGKMNCVLSNEIEVNVGSVSITALNLDVNLHLEKSLDTIVAVVCADLPVCKDAIKSAISKSIKDQIQKQVPKQLAQQVTQLLQGLTSKLKCPTIPSEQGVITV